MTTIHDVAKRAGVSPVTVSRVMNSAKNVNAATRARVEQAIKDLGYLPNLAARSLRSRQTSTLALIVPDITNAFWTTVARGVEDAAQAEEYSVLLCNSDESPVKQNGYINAVLQQRVDGVIIAPYDTNPNNLNQLVELHTPFVILDRRVDGWDVDTVRADSISAAYALTQHLISLGHSRIAIISGPLVTSTAEERVAGYCLALNEAGIAIDPRLILRGEFRVRSGRTLMDQLLDEEIIPTAVVAANNLMAMGILESLQSHGKVVPEEVALVCFDELPDLARFFPFLTVVVQPAYDMGINAAQLLLSRINATTPLRPRQVILPSRLVLRYSCGRFLGQHHAEFAFLNPLKDQSETVLIKPVPAARLQALEQMPGLNFPWFRKNQRDSGTDRSDVNRLVKVLSHQAADRMPHLEVHTPNKAVLEYVLERSLPYSQVDLDSGRQTLSAGDAVEFAQRIGMDAVPCEINWQPGPVTLGRCSSFAEAMAAQYPPPALGEPINRLDNCLITARSSPVGVYASFSGFFDQALRACGLNFLDTDLPDQLIELEACMDALLAHQVRVMRAVCDRFSADLVFILIRDRLFDGSGMDPQSKFFLNAVLPRLKRLISPAREHDLLAGISTPGSIAGALPALYETGFRLIHPLDPDQNDLAAICEQWQGRLALVGGFPTHLLEEGTPEQVEARVQELVRGIGKGSGFVLGASAGVSQDVRPDNFLAMVRAVHRLGVYGTPEYSEPG